MPHPAHDAPDDADAVEPCPYAEIKADDLARLARLGAKVKLEAPKVSTESWSAGLTFPIKDAPMATVRPVGRSTSWPAEGARCRLMEAVISTEGIKIKVVREGEARTNPTSVPIDHVVAVDVPL